MIARSLNVSKRKIAAVVARFESLGLSQSAFAKRLQIARSTLNKYFKGKNVDREVFKTISDTLGLAIAEITDLALDPADQVTHLQDWLAGHPCGSDWQAATHNDVLPRYRESGAGGGRIERSKAILLETIPLVLLVGVCSGKANHLNCDIFLCLENSQDCLPRGIWLRVLEGREEFCSQQSNGRQESIGFHFVARSGDVFRVYIELETTGLATPRVVEEFWV